MAIDSVVRAVGRIVVWVDAAAEDSTMRMQQVAEERCRTPPLPKTEVPRTEITSPTWAGLARPMPLVPIPANACTAKITIP